MFRGLYLGTIAGHIPPTVFYRNYYSTYVQRDIRNVLKVQFFIFILKSVFFISTYYLKSVVL